MPRSLSLFPFYLAIFPSLAAAALEPAPSRIKHAYNGYSAKLKRNYATIEISLSLVLYASYPTHSLLLNLPFPAPFCCASHILANSVYLSNFCHLWPTYFEVSPSVCRTPHTPHTHTHTHSPSVHTRTRTTAYLKLHLLLLAHSPPHPLIDRRQSHVYA